MKATSAQVRTHRIVGCLAVLHGLLVAVPMFAGAYDEAIWFWWFWVALATLWFFWPLVLAVHPGRSLLRIVVPLILAYPGYFLWSGAYSTNVLVRAFHLEESHLDFDLSPHSALPYAFAYGVGWANAKKDAKAGRLILEAYGFGTFTPGAPNFSEAACQQCGIEVTHVAGCVVNERIMGHAKGYNGVMIEEIRRRCGTVVTEAEKEDARWLQSYEDGKEAGRAEALSDLRADRLAIEVSDAPKKGDAEFEQMLRERYQISLRRVDPNADPKMANKVFGHKAGNNEVAEAEITRRFGEDTVSSIWQSLYKTPDHD